MRDQRDHAKGIAAAGAARDVWTPHTAEQLCPIEPAAPVLALAPVADGWLVARVTSRERMALSHVPLSGSAATPLTVKRSSDDPEIPETPFLVVDPSRRFAVSNASSGQVWELPAGKLVARIPDLVNLDCALGWTTDGALLVLAEQDANHPCRIRTLDPSTRELRELSCAFFGGSIALAGDHVVFEKSRGTISPDLRTGATRTWPVAATGIWSLEDKGVLLGIERDDGAVRLERWDPAIDQRVSEWSATLESGTFRNALGAPGSNVIVFASTTCYVAVDRDTGDEVASGPIEAPRTRSASATCSTSTTATARPSRSTGVPGGW